MRLWLLLRDIILTGTGVAVIMFQVFSPHPSDTLLVVGLALTVPSVAGHAAVLLSGRPSPPSPPSQSSGQSSSGSSSQEVPGE